MGRLIDQSKEIKMKKLVLTIVFMLALASNVFAGGVQSDNSGNAGYLFVATGENHGKDSIGVWTSPDALGLKGEKGDTGAQGEQGIPGLNGQDGINGTNGVDGVNGVDGEKGDQGEVGLQGEQGNEGSKGDNGQDGKNGDKGDKGDEGKKGDQGIQGPQGKGLEDRYELIGEVRVLDTKKTTWSIYAGRDVNNNNNIFGAKVTYKLGRSYEERRLDELEARLNKQEEMKTANDVQVVPTPTGFKISNTTQF